MCGGSFSWQLQQCWCSDLEAQTWRSFGEWEREWKTKTFSLAHLSMYLITGAHDRTACGPQCFSRIRVRNWSFLNLSRTWSGHGGQRAGVVDIFDGVSHLAVHGCCFTAVPGGP